MELNRNEVSLVHNCRSNCQSTSDNQFEDFFINTSHIVKLCTGCDKVKILENDFYKAGNSWQKYCKICHNEKRGDYVHKGTKYKKRLTGFEKIPIELQKKIQYDIRVKINFKDIAEKYKNEGIKYQTLLKWNRKGLIPNF